MAAWLPGSSLAQGGGDRGPTGTRDIGPTFVAAAAVEAVALALADQGVAGDKPRKAKKQGLLRWGYVLPRLIVVLAIVGVVRYCLDPALKWAIVTGGEAALGAKVEIGELDTNLRRGELVIRNFAAANPGKPMRNLLESTDSQFTVDVAELCRGRLRVTHGQIRGITFDGERSTSGELPQVVAAADEGPSMFDPLLTAAEEQGAAWFDDVSAKLTTDVESQLQTPALAKQLEERWPKEYAELRAAADDVQARAKSVEVLAREVKKNPLRNVAATEQLAADLLAIEQQVKALNARVAALPKQADADRKALDAARKHDEKFLREQVSSLKKLDGDQLSRYLLGEEAHGYLESTLTWVERARALVPSKRPHAKPPKGRGVNVHFVDRPRPSALVDRLELLGSASLHGQTLELAGLLTNVASQPEYHPEPARLELRGAGAQEFALDVVMDRRTDVPCDTLVFDCPQLPIPGRKLGKAEKIAVEVAPSQASLVAHLELKGDQLAGTIEYVQGGTKLTASAPAVKDAGFGQALNESLANLAKVEATLVLSGTTHHPQYKLRSNLGPDLAAGFDGAFRKYIADRTGRVVAKAQAKVDEQVAKLDAKREEVQAELMAKLGQNQELLAQLGSLSSGQLPASVTLPGGKTVSTDLNAAAAGVQEKAVKTATSKLGDLQKKLKR